jgi:hypothetical protein
MEVAFLRAQLWLRVSRGERSGSDRQLILSEPCNLITEVLTSM